MTASSKPSAGLFTPKLVTVIREGYGWREFRADALAALTVAIVALPLSMAIAIASHAPPQAGLYTAVVGGFLISALGGSRFQIGGPAGAFIVLVASIVDRQGLEGLAAATLMAGAMLLVMGWLRLGTYIKYVPHAVTVGFTAGIALIIFASQVSELLGLDFGAKEPAALVPKLLAIWHALPDFNPAALAVAGVSIAAILVLRRYRPTWPAFLIAVTLAAVLVWLLGLQVETIQTRFGGLPRTLPSPAFPNVPAERLRSLLPDAFALALLGAIESLLSAVVADSMSGRRHRSNCEIVAQGFANIASALFGGLPATGTIARTATNVRAGAHGPVSGILHSVFVLLFILAAAPLAGFIPLASLAAVLAVVCWNMAEKAEFKSLLTASYGEALVLLVAFGLTIFVGLAEGIIVGALLGCLLFMHRMAESVSVQTRHGALVDEDTADTLSLYDPHEASDPDIVIHHLSGAFFFGAASAVASALERVNARPKAFILDFEQVPFIDYSAAHSLRSFLQRATRHGVPVYLTGAATNVRRDLIRFGLKKPLVHYGHSIHECANAIRRGLEIDSSGG